MELIAKSEDQQGSRYQFAGSFNLIEEDWMLARTRNKKNASRSSRIPKQQVGGSDYES